MGSLMISDLYCLIEFEIQFNAGTPMVNGDSVLLSFSSTVPVDEAICEVTPFLGSADCEFYCSATVVG